jgi:hypothetical protein
MSTRRASAPTTLSESKTASASSSAIEKWNAILTIEDTIKDTKDIENRAEFDRAALEAWRGVVASKEREDVGYEVGDGRWSPGGGVYFYD